MENTHKEKLILNSMYLLCDVCRENPSSTVKGGTLPNGGRGLWFCCEKCKRAITDLRWGDRRGLVGDRRE